MKKAIFTAVFLAGIISSSKAQCDLLHGPVVINEFLAENLTAATNAEGVHADYIEIYNSSNASFNMEGWFLSDSREGAERTKFQFPNVSIPGGGYLIIWCDGVGDPEMPGLNADFALSSTNGEMVVLSNPDTAIVDFVRFPPIDGDVSMGRFPNGSGPFTTMPPSFNGPNATGDAFNVVINEYMATNSATAADEFGEYDDWIELYNNSNQPIDLSGYFLSDSENNPTKFVFPQGTVIAGNQYFVVWADNQPEQGPYHADFALSASGEKVILSLPDTTTIDFFAFGQQTTDVSEGRFPNGLGSLIGCMEPTFMAENQGGVSPVECELLRGPVVINEFLAENLSTATNAVGLHEDYVELYNTSDEPFNMEGWFLSDSRGSNGRTKYQFPNVVIPGGGYLIVWCDGEGDPEMPGLNADFSLSSTAGEMVVLSNPDSVIVDFVRFPPIDGDVSMGRFPNGTGPFTTMVPSFNGANTNGAAFNVVINEYMATNSETAADEYGEYDDWIELYNNGSQPVNLTGYFLSDNENNPTKYEFPQGSVIGANQYHIVWADNQPEQGPNHAAFALSASGEKVILSLPDTTTIDFFAFGPQVTDVSEGRSPNGIGPLIACMAPTFMAENMGAVSTENTPEAKEILKLFPNPAGSFFQIEHQGLPGDPLVISDIYGRVVDQKQLQPGLNRINIDALAPAIYIATTPIGSVKFIKSAVFY